MLHFLIFSRFQMIIPNSANIFGSQSLGKIVGGNNYVLALKISRTYNKAMNQISEPCKNPSTSKCIADWIQDKIGCSIKINGGGGFQDQLRPCISGSQLQDLWEISSTFQFADAKIIYEKTGCLASCEKYEFGKLETTFVKKPVTFGGCKAGFKICNLDLKLEIPQHEITYQATKQYVVYDFNSFIADVGGFMGLLLGFSILSLYDELVKSTKEAEYLFSAKINMVYQYSLTKTHYYLVHRFMDMYSTERGCLSVARF